MKLLDGYKSKIGCALGVVVGVMQGLGYIDDGLAKMGYTIAASVFGYGMADKFKKVAEALSDGLKQGVILLAVGLGAMALLSPAPAYAADCEFDKGFDAKVFRAAWPPMIGFDVGVIDFEVGISDFGTNACGNVSVKPLGLICMIPKVGDLLGPLCSESDQ